MTTRYRYTGPGVYIGVPARDLTQAEYDAMGADRKRIVNTSGAYKQVADSKPAPDAQKQDASKPAATEHADNGAKKKG